MRRLPAALSLLASLALLAAAPAAAASKGAMPHRDAVTVGPGGGDPRGPGSNCPHPHPGC
jgi:hypothetical protein